MKSKYLGFGFFILAITVVIFIGGCVQQPEQTQPVKPTEPQPTSPLTKVLPSDEPPSAKIEVSNLLIPEGQSVEFSVRVTDEDISTLNYYWDFGDGTSSNSKQPSHQFLNSGTYKVTLKVTDKKGQSTHGYVSIKVEDVIKKEAGQIIITEADVKEILGADWGYSGTSIATGKSTTKGLLSEYSTDFAPSDYMDLNPSGSVKVGLILDVGVNVFSSSSEAKNYFEWYKGIFAKEKDYVIQELNVGDRGILSMSRQRSMGIFQPPPKYFFQKKNVFVSMNYGQWVSGNLDEIDKTSYANVDIYGTFGASEINRLRLVQLQASRIAD